MTVHTTNQPADEVLTNALRNDRRPSDTDRQQFRKAKDIESNRGWVGRSWRRGYGRGRYEVGAEWAMRAKYGTRDAEVWGGRTIEWRFGDG